MDARQLELSRPCPVDLDAAGVDRSGARFYCGHCERDVHVLSNMTRAAARAFVEANRGKGVCVSYLRAADGSVRYAPEPAPALVPLARLRARAPRLATAALALAACTPHGDGPTVSFDGATPIVHDARVIPSSPAPAPTGSTSRPQLPERPLILEGPLPPERPEEQVDGELAPLPPPALPERPEEQVEGKLAPLPPAALPERPEEQVEGELVREPPDPLEQITGDLAVEPAGGAAEEPCAGSTPAPALHEQPEQPVRGRLRAVDPLANL
ncbi:MAG: hypothetical protein KC468_35180 [Myxococcales bacterium]|nr:hypothetical protein [Myxococcales bacterium]